MVVLIRDSACPPTTFGDKKQLGDPISFYVFQGARLPGLIRLSLNYEWNFGLSAGWKPYDNDYNSYNGAVGSRRMPILMPVSI